MAAVVGMRGSKGDRVLAAAARFFRALAIRGKPSFWDEHSTNNARFYDLLCQLKGAFPESYVELVAADVLPKERAVRCAHEFQQARAGWNTLLEPYSNVIGGRTFTD